MKYTININQKAVIDNGWFILKANHMAVIDVISTMILSKNFKEMNDIYGQWFWVSPKLIVKQLPMFDIGDRRCVQLIDDLVTCGLIEKNPDNQALNRTFIRMGTNYSKLMFDSLQNHDSAMKNISDLPMKNISDLPMKNISDNNSIINNSTKDNNIDTPKIKTSPLEAKKENKEIKNKEIPTLKEFGEFALSKQSDFDLPIDKKKVKLKYEVWIENGWKDGNNKSIIRWKAKLLATLPYLLSDQKETKPETPLRRKAL